MCIKPIKTAYPFFHEAKKKVWAKQSGHRGRWVSKRKKYGAQLLVKQLPVYSRKGENERPQVNVQEKKESF